MQAEIFAGNPVRHRRQTFTVSLDELDPERAARVEAILDAVELHKDGTQVTVLDSGIDPERKFGPSADELIPMDFPIVESIGQLPEIETPTDDLDEVLVAWEHWIQAYCGSALAAIDELNRERPKGQNPFKKEISWGGIRVDFGPGAETAVQPDDGPKAMQDARAAWAWTWAAGRRFSTESVEAAREATFPATSVSREWIETLSREEVSARFLEVTKRMHAAAKAYDKAQASREPDFDAEMASWAVKRGSVRLQLGIEDGYRMNARYLAERLAAEAPGFFAMPAKSANKDWARQTTSPSEEALRLRRLVEKAMRQSAPDSSSDQVSVEIMTVTEPPPQLYFADGETDLPDSQGWPWWYGENNQPFGYGAKPFEAVVVRNWLGRFHLIGAVPDDFGRGPAGIWAVPQISQFREDGSVETQDPDQTARNAAKRKPPSPGEDEIPF
jgi:hypothetical protein